MVESGAGRTLREARDGEALSTDQRPSADTWYIEPVHSSVGFIAGLQRFARVRGRFRNVSGVVWISERLEDSAASVSIEANSIDSGIEKRDAHLRSPEFLDVENHPNITWRGSGAEPTDDPAVWLFHGDLTLKGVTRPVTLSGTFLGEEPFPFGKATMISLAGTARFNRFEFGLDAMPSIPGASLFIGSEVEIALEVALLNNDIRFFTYRFLSGRR